MDYYDEVIMRRSWRQHEASREIIWEVIRWVAIVGFLLGATRADAHDFARAERFKKGPLRIAPYPPLQTAQIGGATVILTVFVVPKPITRHLRVDWYYPNGEQGAAERDLDAESPMEFTFGPAKHVPPGNLIIVATVRERFVREGQPDTYGKVLHRIERKAVIAGGE